MLYITTPYYAVEESIQEALCIAADAGVDVRLMIPAIPDKKLVYLVAETYWGDLLRHGVKIYEYTPGFVHAKVFVCDDREAVVGTINLDYRSLYHHFENAVWMRRVGSIRDMETDFQDTLACCRTVEATLQSVWQGKKLLRLMGLLLKVIAPLM